MKKIKQDPSTVQALNRAITPIQQAVVNILESYNADLLSRKIDKKYSIAMRIFDKNHKTIIGDERSADLVVELKYNLLANGKLITLFSCNVPLGIQSITDEQLVLINNKMDIAFLVLIKEALGVLGLVAEQHIEKHIVTKPKEDIKINKVIN